MRVSCADGRCCAADFRRLVPSPCRLVRESGAAPGEIQDVVRFLAECGIAKAAAALRELDTILGAG